MILSNWLILPIWTGRNIGEFVSRTKYINSTGKKPIFFHAIFNNSLGYMFLMGFLFVGVNFQNLSNSTGMTYVIVGAILMIIWIVNFFFKKNSDYSQGLFDLAFSSYLVKHVATGDETGWLARFESLGDFGDKWQQRSETRQEKAKVKAEKKAAKAAEANESSEESEDDTSESEKNLRIDYGIPNCDLEWSPDSPSANLTDTNHNLSSIRIYLNYCFVIDSHKANNAQGNFYWTNETKSPLFRFRLGNNHYF